MREQSIQAQKKIFESVRGVSWNSCHTPLSELQEISMLQRGLKRDVAERVVKSAYYDGNSHGYRIGQELFVDPRDFVVPGDLRAEAASADPRAPRKEEKGAEKFYSQLGLLYTQVPEFLAVALGALPAVPRSETQQIVDCSRPDVILTVKYYVERLMALGSRSLQRTEAKAGGIAGVGKRERPNLLILPCGPAREGVDSLYLPLFRELGFEPPRDETGSLLFLRAKRPCADPIDVPFPPERVCQFFPTVYPALRKTLHEDRSYREESEVIQRLRTDWEAYRETSMAGWTSMEKFKQIEGSRLSAADKAQALHNAESRNAEIVARYNRMLDCSIEHFSGSRHKERGEIYETLVRMKAKLEESQTQRINPSPIILQIRGNDSRSDKRKVDIRVKNGYNSNDEDLLRSTIDDGAQRVAKIREALDQSPSIANRPASIFDAQAISRSQIKIQAAAIIKDLAIPIELLEYKADVACSKVRPFTRYYESLMPVFEAVMQEVVNGRRAEVKGALARMRLMLDVCQADQLVNNLVGDLSERGRSDALVTIVDNACTISAEIAARGPLFGSPCGVESRAVARETKAIFGRLAKTMKELQAQLVEMRQQEAQRPGALPDLQQETEFIENARRKIESFNFEGVLSRLEPR